MSVVSRFDNGDFLAPEPCVQYQSLPSTARLALAWCRELHVAFQAAGCAGLGLGVVRIRTNGRKRFAR